MRAAMLEAELGDDVFGDDPTVNQLTARLASDLGFEAALFFPTGTQSNLAGLMAHCGRGDEYLVGQLAHTYRHEAGGAAVLGSITVNIGRIEGGTSGDGIGREAGGLPARLLRAAGVLHLRRLAADHPHPGW